MEDLFWLDGAVAVVTGGTGGLGGAMAHALAHYGARIVLIGRSQERGEARKTAIEASINLHRELPQAMFLTADVHERGVLEQVAKQIEDQWGPASILVNAAGGNRPEATLPPGTEFSQLPLEAWKGVFDLNLVGGALLPTQVFATSMLEQKRGSVINIASMSGMVPLSRVVAYSAAKAAVLNLTQFLAREWAARGVRVNAISPGFFPAEQNRALLYQPDGSLSARGSQIIGHTPMGRFGVPDELSGAVIWLASQAASSFVTGQNIVVDGGFSSCTI